MLETCCVFCSVALPLVQCIVSGKAVGKTNNKSKSVAFSIRRRYAIEIVEMPEYST